MQKTIGRTKEYIKWQKNERKCVRQVKGMEKGKDRKVIAKKDKQGNVDLLQERAGRKKNARIN